MRDFPAICVDDFYSDPDSIREWALTLDYDPCIKAGGTWPGRRTESLHRIDPVFFDQFCRKIFSLYIDVEQPGPEWRVLTQFQLIDSYDSDSRSKKNTGWIHYDTGAIFGGIIYLTPNINENCGTSLYKQVKEYNGNENLLAKQRFFKEGYSDDYEERMVEHESHFLETIEYKNIYNRMISFDSYTAHRANSFYSTTPRLTQIFFIEKYNPQSTWPMNRHKKYL